MKIGKKIKRAFFRRVIKPSIIEVYQKEDSIADMPGVITANDLSPTRFDIPMSIIERVEQGKDQSLMISRTMPTMRSNIKNIKISLDSIDKNSDKPRDTIDDDFLHVTFFGAFSRGFPTQYPQALEKMSPLLAKLLIAQKV